MHFLFLKLLFMILQSIQLMVAPMLLEQLLMGTLLHDHTLGQQNNVVRMLNGGKAVLLVSLELDEVMNISDRILVMYEGEIVGELDPKTTTVQELGLYMAGAKRSGKGGAQA